MRHVVSATRDADDDAGPREHRALGQDLADHPAMRGAECLAER
jgi:hypothetical protein